MINNKNILFIGLLMILLMGNVKALNYGDVVTQKEYDKINFDKAYLNPQYVLEENGLVISCDPRTGLCSIDLQWDTFENELETLTILDEEGNESEWFNPTGNYIFVQKTKTITFSYSQYINIQGKNPSYATQWARELLVTKANYYISINLDHLQKLKTTTATTIDLGGSLII